MLEGEEDDKLIIFLGIILLSIFLVFSSFYNHDYNFILPLYIQLEIATISNAVQRSNSRDGGRGRVKYALNIASFFEKTS